MPIYEYACPQCSRAFEALVPVACRNQMLCRVCGCAVNREWRHAPTMRPDSIPGGLVLENLTPQPKRFYSRTEIKDEMRARGVEAKVRHVGAQGSDKSKHTSRWV